MSGNRIIAAFITLASSLCFSAFAVAGIGIHWGNDLSMQMDDKMGDQLVFTKLNINSGVGNYTGTINGVSLPIYIDRSDWDRKLFNFGVKFYIDVIPLIDALELSGNFGAWEYKGVVRYPKSLTYTGSGTAVPTAKDFSATYDTMPITLDNFDMGYLGISNTPYLKLNFDLTVRKYIVQFPKPLKTLRLYGGGGVSVIFATPVVSASLIEDALGNVLNTTKSLSEMGTQIFGDKEIMKAVVKEIGSQLMTPHWGCHIDLGVMIKIPVLPVGIYVDGKFMIPFGDLDEEVDVGGTGFLLNAGVSLAF